MTELAEQGDAAALEHLPLNGKLAPLIERPLLLALKEEALVPDDRLEKLLTLLRRALLFCEQAIHHFSSYPMRMTINLTRRPEAGMI